MEFRSFPGPSLDAGEVLSDLAVTSLFRAGTKTGGALSRNEGLAVQAVAPLPFSYSDGKDSDDHPGFFRAP